MSPAALFTFQPFEAAGGNIILNIGEYSSPPTPPPPPPSRVQTCIAPANVFRTSIFNILVHFIYTIFFLGALTALNFDRIFLPVLYRLGWGGEGGYKKVRGCQYSVKGLFNLVTHCNEWDRLYVFTSQPVTPV